MAKKNKSKNPASLSPEAYLKQGNARKLPIHGCFVPREWKKLKKFPVFISRKHSNGNLTVANFLVDLFCTGVKDSLYLVNFPEYEFKHIIEDYNDKGIDMIQCDYALAHNIIYESLAYAEEFHIDPLRDFKYAEMILEEDDDNIPLIDIPLGYEGKPLLILHPEDPRNT